MRKVIILLAVLLLSIGCISENVEKPKVEEQLEERPEGQIINISWMTGHLEDYENNEVLVIGRSRGDPVLIGETAYADIEDGTGRVIIIFNPKEFINMIDVHNGDEIRVRGILRVQKDQEGEEEKTMIHIGAPYFIEPVEVQFLKKE